MSRSSPQCSVCRPLGALIVGLASSFALLVSALDTVMLMIPANPGGGWDTTGRNLGQAMTKAGAVKNVQYDNKGGAGGTIGLAQFVNTSKGDGNAVIGNWLRR